MKATVFFLLLFTSAGLVFSCKNETKKGAENAETLTDTIPAQPTPNVKYVTAVSGLTLREHPNLQSNKLTVMPLGSQVKVIKAEEQPTMNVGGIDGAMDEVEFNNQRGFAFNGFLSRFFPAGENAAAAQYAQELKKDFPQVTYTESTGGTATKPTKTEVLVLPTSHWHEGFFIAQQLFGIPRSFAFPNPKGANHETQQNNNQKKGDLINELQISRNGNQLQKIEYKYKTKGHGYTVTITKEGDAMRLEKTEMVE